MQYTYLLVAEKSLLPIIHITTKSILMHGNPKKISIIVPENQVAEFKAATNGQAEIISEYHIISDWNLDKIKIYLNKMPERAGWYLQQFLKLEYARKSGVNDYIIWDADTVMLNSIKFSDKQITYFNESREKHQPYFKTIEKLLGIKKFLKSSVVSQYIYIKSDIAKKMLEEIEARHENEWIKVVLEKLEQKSLSEFSEYETYANYYASLGGEFKINKRKWFRYGSEIIDYKKINDLESLSNLFKGYDYVAFERHSRNILRKFAAKILLKFKASS